MKVIIIPTDSVRFYDKSIDAFDRIKPLQLVSGEWFLSEDILVMFDRYINGNYPNSIKLSANYLKSELQAFELREVTESDFKAGSFELPVYQFPYPNRNIRVFIEHKQVTEMLLSVYKPLIEYGLSIPHEKDSNGVTLWLEHLENEGMTAEQVTEALENFGANITIKQ
jgi:hypothetical protein